MKRLILGALAVVFLSGALVAMTPPPDTLAPFEITVLKSPSLPSTDGLRMVCRKGCAWKELSFGGEQAVIDFTGVSNIGRAVEGSEMPAPAEHPAASQGQDFSFAIRLTPEGVEMTCQRGCAWRTLTFEGTQADISHIGVTNIRR